MRWLACRDLSHPCWLCLARLDHCVSKQPGWDAKRWGRVLELMGSLVPEMGTEPVVLGVGPTEGGSAASEIDEFQ